VAIARCPNDQCQRSTFKVIQGQRSRAVEGGCCDRLEMAKACCPLSRQLVAYWQIEWSEGVGGGNSSPKFHPAGKFSCLKVFFQKVQNLGLKIPILGEFKSKIEILSTRNLFCRKFSAFSRKLATSCPLQLS